MSNPKQYVLADQDALFFYQHSSKSVSDIANRKNISDLANKYGIKIIFNSQKCQIRKPVQDTIELFQVDKNKNQTFFRSIRNAFAHLYIEIQANRCKLLDWNPYKDGVQHKFCVSCITMKGDVNYNAFKALLDDFFKQKPKNKKDVKNIN